MLRKIVYNKNNGNIVAVLPIEQNHLTYFHHFSDEFKDNLSSIITEISASDINDFKVVNGKLVKMSKQEISEIKQYGRILTEEERLLNKLKPSPEEVKKAEQTIEILTLIQEVI